MPNAMMKHIRRAVSVLHVCPVEDDQRSLEKIFRHTNWQLQQARSLASAAVFLKQVPVAVILSECDLNPGHWKDLLREIATLPAPPQLIVTSRLADDALWGEVLNLGAYDLLAKPFEFSEVVHAISLAWWHWDSQKAFARKPPNTASSLRPPPRAATRGAV